MVILAKKWKRKSSLPHCILVSFSAFKNHFSSGTVRSTLVSGSIFPFARSLACWFTRTRSLNPASRDKRGLDGARRTRSRFELREFNFRIDKPENCVSVTRDWKIIAVSGYCDSVRRQPFVVRKVCAVSYPCETTNKFGFYCAVSSWIFSPSGFLW